MMKSKKYVLVMLSLFLILLVFAASASAADVNGVEVLSADESAGIANEKLALDSSSYIYIYPMNLMTVML